MTARLMAMAKKSAGGYEGVVAATSPTYFWPLQGDLVASHGGVSLTNQGTHAISYVAGPGMETSDQAVRGVQMSLLASGVNANANTNGFSYGGWLNIANLTTKANTAVIGNWTSSVGSMLFIYSTTHLAVYVGGAMTTYAHGLTNSTWHHFIVTMDPADKKVRIYVDGALAHTSTALTSAALGSSTALRLGSYATNASPGWRPDQDAAWCGWWNNKTLSLAQIEALAGV